MIKLIPYEGACGDPPPGVPLERHPKLQCPCGRFARWVGDQHYYNGTYNCYRYTVHCSRCGDVDIECV